MKKCVAVFLLSAILLLSACAKRNLCENGHMWQDATCTAPKRCAVCSQTRGQVVEHNLRPGTVIKQATYSETGLEICTCVDCKEQVEVVLPLKESLVYRTYREVLDLTKQDLEKLPDGRYVFNGIPLLREQNVSIDNEWMNPEGHVSQDAMYNKMAKLIEGYSLGNDYKAYSMQMFGFIPPTMGELKPYIDNAKTFVVSSGNELEVIMKKFETLSCVKGTFDYSSMIFNFVIDDLSECADEMMISEEMLGYVFGMLDCYAPIVEFCGNSCVFSYLPFQ